MINLNCTILIGFFGSDGETLMRLLHLTLFHGKRGTSDVFVGDGIATCQYSPCGRKFTTKMGSMYMRIGS